MKKMMEKGVIPSEETINLAMKHQISDEVVTMILDRLFDNGYGISNETLWKAVLSYHVSIPILYLLLEHFKEQQIDASTVVKIAKEYKDEGLVRKMLDIGIEKINTDLDGDFFRSKDVPSQIKKLLEPYKVTIYSTRNYYF